MNLEVAVKGNQLDFGHIGMTNDELRNPIDFKIGTSSQLGYWNNRKEE